MERLGYQNGADSLDALFATTNNTAMFNMKFVAPNRAAAHIEASSRTRHFDLLNATTIMTTSKICRLVAP